MWKIKQRNVNSTPAKILIAAAAREHDWWSGSIMTFINLTHSCPPGSEIDVQIENGLVQNNRNVIFRKAKKENFDYVMQLDSDISLLDGPQPTISYLIEQSKKHGADIIGGIYIVKPGGNARPTALMLGDNGFGYIDKWPDKIVEVDACGGGFMFLTKKVLQAFTLSHDEQPFDFIPWRDYPHTDGEDLAFCYRARKLGLKIMVDPAFDLGHIKPTVWRKGLAK